MLQQLKNALIGKQTSYRSYHFDYDLPLQTAQVSNVTDFYYDGQLTGYLIEFNSSKVPAYVVDIKLAKKLNLNENYIRLTPSHYELHGTTTWVINTQN